MSEKHTNGICLTCGSEVGEKDKFCSVCGSALQTSDASDEPTSASDTVALSQAPSAKAPVGIKGRLLNNKEMIFRIIAFAVAVLLLLMATNPIVRLRFEVEDDVYTSVGLGASDVIKLGVDAVISLFVEESDVMQSDLYEEYSDLVEDYPDEIGPKVSDKENKMFGELWMLAVKLAFRSGRTVPLLDIAPAFVASVLYLAACIVYLICAFINLLKAFLGKPKPADATVRKMIFAVSMLPVVFFTVSAFARFGTGGSVYALSALASVSASGAFIFSVIIAIGYLAIICVRSALRRRGGLNKRYFVKSLVMCIASVIVVIALFMPFVTSNINVKVEGKRIKVNASAPSYSFSMMEEDEGEMLNDTDTDDLEEMLGEAAYLLKKGKLDGSDKKRIEELIVHFTIASDNAEPYMLLYPVTYCISLLALAFSLALAVKTLRRFIGVEKKPRSIVPLKVLNLCSVIGYFVTSTLLAMSSNNLMEYADIEKLCYTRIGIGPDLALVVSVLMLFVVFRKSTEEKAKQYDVADVSYAPYNF